MINQKLFLIVLVGLAVAHVMASIGESLIRRGALLLDRDTMDRVWAREARSASLWKGGETLAVVVMVAGLVNHWSSLLGPRTWGITAVAVGFGMFCISSIARAWLYRAAFAAEAPGSKASRGALLAGILTTLAELAVGFAVCGYIYIHHIPAHPSTSRTSTTSATETGTATAVSVNPPPGKPKFFVSEAEALELLPGKDARYLQGLVDTKRVRTRTEDGKLGYHRDDIVKEKEAGLPEASDLGIEDEQQPKNNEKTERVEP